MDEIKKKRTGIWIALISVVALAVLIFNPISCCVYRIRQFERVTDKKMQDPMVYEPVGKALARYCQSDKSLLPEHLSYAWFPTELNEIGSGYAWGSAKPDGAFVELGGGFHHFGYRVDLDKDKSSDEYNNWQLSYYSEGSPDIKLKGFRLKKNEKYDREEILARLTSAYDVRIQKKPKDEDAYKGKIAAYLRFNKVQEARGACRSMLEALPDEWWPVLANALIISETESPSSGEVFITGWVDRNKNFFSYMDLAYYYQLRNQPKESANAIRASVLYDANTTWGHGGNAEFRGYTAAMFAYQSGEYDAVIAVCDHLLKVTINGNFAKGALQDLKKGAINSKSKLSTPQMVHWSQNMKPFDPFDSVDIEKLLGRKVHRLRNI